MAKRPDRRDYNSTWLGVSFLLFTFLSQVPLLPGLQSSTIRIGLRALPFVASLGMFVAYRGPVRWRHPAYVAATLALVVVWLCMFHPLTNSVPGLAQAVLTSAVIAPLWWGCRMTLPEHGFRVMTRVIWGLNTAGAVLGVLQIYYPGQFQPAMTGNYGTSYIEALKLRLDDGTMIFRPMGLTDTPGGAAVSGFGALLFGLALFLVERQIFLRAIYLASVLAGLFCIYMCQVRSLLVVGAVCALGYVVIFTIRGWLAQSVSVLAVVSVLGILGLAWAMSFGGQAISKRYSTLFQDAPLEVYQSNRGIFLTDTFENQLPTYPLGAGLGRYGMMYSYFSRYGDSTSAPLWAEIQWTSWLYDGGLPLMLLYSACMALTLGFAFRVAMYNPSKVLACWGAAVFSYNLSVMALTFNCCPFASSMGLDFWVINSFFYSAVQTARLKAVRRVGLLPA